MPCIAEYLLCLFRIGIHIGGAKCAAIPIEQGLEMHVFAPQSGF